MAELVTDGFELPVPGARIRAGNGSFQHLPTGCLDRPSRAACHWIPASWLAEPVVVGCVVALAQTAWQCSES